MKKKPTSWIIPALLTILTTITTFYCLLEYRSSVLIVGISSLLLLASAFWLFTCIAKLNQSEPETSIGEEQRMRMNYEGMKLQGEELIRLVNSLGKGTYVNSKRSAEHLQNLLEQFSQAQQTNEELIHTLIQEQTKTAKFQVKYAQDDNSKIIKVLTEQCSRLNESLEKCTDAIRSQDSASVSSGEPITASLNELSKELAHINTSIQALQLQLTSAVSQPNPYVTEPEIVSGEPTPTESVPDEPEIVPEEPTPAEPEIVPEEPAPTEPDASSIISDDPNKQLSPDEIAALFAALG